MGGFADTFLNLDVMRRSLPAVASGFAITVELAALVVVTGLAAGLGLALLRLAGPRALGWLIVFAVDLFRALPPLVIILLIYFGAPAFGATPSGFLCTWASLSLVLMAFAEEIFWAGLTAVPAGQWEAARSTGLGFAQALRMAVPPLTNRTVAITKGTALGSVVAVSEILSQSTSAMSFSGNPSPLTLGALAYLVLFAPLVALGRWVERRWAQHPAAAR